MSIFNRIKKTSKKVGKSVSKAAKTVEKEANKAAKAVEKEASKAAKAVEKEANKAADFTEEALKEKIVKDVLDVTKDIGTPILRIGTDSALDLANVATGFQFNGELESAKETMSDVGLLSAAEAIEKNHYGFLEDMEAEATEKYNKISSLIDKGRALETKRDEKVVTLTDILVDVGFLAQMSKEATEIFGKLTNIPGWEKWAEMLELKLLPLEYQLAEYVNKWTEASGRIAQTQQIAGLAESATGTLGLLSEITRAAQASKAARTTTTATKGTKATKGANVGKAAKLGQSGMKAGGKASKFLKFGRMAGKASAVLAVATIGLDIGLSVSQLEDKKKKLESYIQELNDGIAEAEQDTSDLRSEIREIDLQMYSLIGNVNPSQTVESWPAWVAAQKIAFAEAREQLVSAAGIRERATKMAKNTQQKKYADRLKLVADVDISISEEDAVSIIAEVDKAFPLAGSKPEVPVPPSEWAEGALRNIYTQGVYLAEFCLAMGMVPSEEAIAGKADLILEELKATRPMGEKAFSQVSEIIATLREALASKAVG